MPISTYRWHKYRRALQFEKTLFSNLSRTISSESRTIGDSNASLAGDKETNRSENEKQSENGQPFRVSGYGIIGATRNAQWPAAGSADTELGVLMEPEVCHGETEVYTRVQA
jgi:hypothetical protein